MSAPVTLVFDVETVPDLAAMRRAGADPAAEAEGGRLKPAWQRVVAVACALIAPSGALRRLGALGAPHWGEAELVAEWFRLVARLRPRLVGWNSGGFDIPVLVARAVVLGVEAPEFYRIGEPWHGYRRRFDEEGHVDLMDVLSGYGSAPRMALRDMAAALGVPAKADGGGADVAAWVEAGDIGRVRAYCETDVLATAVIFGRYAAHRGWFDATQATTFEQSVAAFLAEAQGEHWGPWRAWRPSITVIGTGTTWEPASRAPMDDWDEPTA